MINRVIKTCHDDLGHFGNDKVCEIIMRCYWFQNMKEKVRNYINNCLKCIMFSKKPFKHDGELNNISKGNIPFDTIHIDHYGPITMSNSNYRYVFEVIDGFTKFIRLFPCKTTNTSEALKHLKNYFMNYSIPKRIISDRGSCFTSNSSEAMMNELDIKHVLIATACPKSNGQIERYNRVLTPLISKLMDSFPLKGLSTILNEAEFFINNTLNRSTGNTASKLLFGVNQRLLIDDEIRKYLESKLNTDRDLIKIRQNSLEKINKIQIYNKNKFDKKM